jgi:hypothetical protein
VNVAIKSTQLNERSYNIIGSRKDRLRVKKFLLNRIFRYCKLPKDEDLSPFSEDLYEELSVISQVPLCEVKRIIGKALVEIDLTYKFLKTCDLLSSTDPAKARIYLHKCYRIAPIFDYKRARENLIQLQEFFRLEGYIQKVSTQITFAIYITDKNNKYTHRKIKQNNLRRLTSCSAYAFHRLINRLKSRGIQV